MDSEDETDQLDELAAWIDVGVMAIPGAGACVAKLVESLKARF